MVTAVFVAQAALSAPANAAPGELDPSFGIGGKVTTDFAFGSGSFDRGQAVALQPDGKIVAAGTVSASEGSRFALSRYNADGTLDTSFGSGGTVITDFGNRFSQGEDMAVQPDGKIVVVGVAFTGEDTAVFALARYEPDGSLDAAFGTGGKVTTDFGRSFSRAEAMALQPDGKIVVAGHVLARYNQDGTLDSAFGTGGKVDPSFGLPIDVALQSDGKIVTGGGSGDFQLVRYNPNGSLDTTFGIEGRVRTDFGGDDAILSVALQTDGKIVASGTSLFFGPPDTFAFELARYGPDGTLDPSFGTDGKVTTNFGGTKELALSVALQTDGKIVAAGRGGTTANIDFALARYNRDGSLDDSFGAGGKVTTDFAGSLDAATALALQPDGRIVAAGTAEVALEDDFALARYEGHPTCTITGTLLDDNITGTSGHDVICPLGGNDAVHGLRGNDTVLGGDGDDRVFGGPGDDTLEGEAGDDFLVGQAGADTLGGGEGDDILKARDDVSANDTLDGGPGTDACQGDSGDSVTNCP